MMSLSRKRKSGIGAISRIIIISLTGTRDGIITKARLHIFFCIRECIHETGDPAYSMEQGVMSLGRLKRWCISLGIAMVIGITGFLHLADFD